jgi:predicted metal-binding membrane protein
VERLTASAAPAAPAAPALPAVGPPLVRQRNVILAALLVLAAVGWVVFIRQATNDGGMEHGMMDHGPDLSMDGSASLFLSMWVAMMVAMMFPAAAPMILMYARMERRNPANTVLFTGSYIALWFAFGALAFALAVGAEELVEGSSFAARNWGRAGGALLVAAGLYQVSPLKDFCLRQCRNPLSFLMHAWHGGGTGAVRMGLHHGLYCAGCCWLLFLALVPLGVMNAAAMLVVAAIVFAEKALPWAREVTRLAAVGLVVYGLLVVVRPELLPTVA